MAGWWRRLFPGKTALSGAPARLRQKSYSAQSGYVYQYFYTGQRPAAGGAEHVFQISADRRRFVPVSVLLEHAAVAAWETAHGRQLKANERYAVVKMALFQAFDERSQPSQMRQEVRVRPADLAGFVETLGLE